MTKATTGQAFHRHWRRLETFVIGVLVVLALVIFLYGSFARAFAPALAIDWSEEVTIYLIVWATLLSGGTLTSERAHVSAQLVVHRLSPRARRRLRVGIDILMLAFCVLLTWLGIEGVLFADMLDERSASTLQAPQAWALYLALPVSMLLIAVRVAVLLLFDRAGDDA
ncbi:MAG: TRAP transporter small permease subunit [Gammaproteobacteria bacterium]